MNRGRKREDGFSLIELAIILAIVSLIVGVVLQEYRYYSQNKEFGTTQTSSIALATALSNHLFNFGDLPCPASPKLPIGDQRAGKAAGNSDMSSSNNGIYHRSCLNWVKKHAVGVTALTPYCEAKTASDEYGICIVSGQRQTTYGAANNFTVGNDLVLIGTVPYVDLGLTQKQSLDGWGNRLTYAVSFWETQATVVSSQGRQNLGAINIETFDRTKETIPGDVTAWSRGSWSDTGIPNSYMYVAFSNGPDGKGAYSSNGTLVAPCAGAGWDVENCDGDSTFRISGATAKDSVFSEAPGADFYDDLDMIYSVNDSRDKWSYTSLTSMYNKNAGSVAIGSSTINQKIPEAILPAGATSEPYKLDVTGAVQVNHLDADYLCDGNGANCLPQSLLAASTCNGELLTGFANGQPICMNALQTATIMGSTVCAAGTRLTGLQCVSSPCTQMTILCHP